ncbi:hypothetical protein HPP92_002596 [Vanilla planifolia]|uniref:Uncharacterized protein n=1 Tax=Vanilla planifolia TaxID=51239 RepID=A0A835VJ37_VANPL|nr:hypothetical protein HPP92_002596 [Vanilla planifolia]
MTAGSIREEEELNMIKTKTRGGCGGGAADTDARLDLAGRKYQVALSRRAARPSGSRGEGLCFAIFAQCQSVEQLKLLIFVRGMTPAAVRQVDNGLRPTGYTLWSSKNERPEAQHEQFIGQEQELSYMLRMNNQSGWFYSTSRGLITITVVWPESPARLTPWITRQQNRLRTTSLLFLPDVEVTEEHGFAKKPSDALQLSDKRRQGHNKSHEMQLILRNYLFSF